GPMQRGARRRRDERRRRGEERLLDVLGVVPTCQVLVDGQGADLVESQSLALETADDLAGGAPANPVGLDHDEGALLRHGRQGYPRRQRAPAALSARRISPAT